VSNINVNIIIIIDKLLQDRLLEAEPIPRPQGCNPPALGQFAQNNDSGCPGCNNNSFVKRMSSDIIAEPVTLFCIIADTLVDGTTGRGLRGRH
jgi:hypothetical protein